MLANNERLIKEKYSWILDIINAGNQNSCCCEAVVEKNTGRAPTINVLSAGKKAYLHSKYDPYKEAVKIITGYEDISSYDYIVFFGFALGYHVEHFINKFPKIHFSIFEPKFEIFKKSLESRDISFLENSSFDGFYFAEIDQASGKKLEETLNNLNCNILVIPLASYETAFPEEYNDFYKMFGQYFKNTAIVDNTKKRNEKLHTVNVLNNFNLIMNTPNVIRQKQDLFGNKPAVLVSAGPSLEYEIENLRYISENGLAYIFSAGSAINTLIDRGIYPHACFSIDPTEGNLKVYKKLINMGIKSVPLFFGTTASTAVVKSYPGRLYHFVTSKDLVTPYYLGESFNAEEVIDTASSVAVVALLTLYKLSFSPIILVGQNLAYKDQRYYSSGIDYNAGAGVLDGGHFEHLYKVQSVDGGYVYSNDSLNCFRKDMEHYIRACSIDNIINTTRNGAAINGTIYVPLDELLRDRLSHEVVDSQWELKLQGNYDVQLARKQSSSIKAELDKFYTIIHELEDLSSRIYCAENAGSLENLGISFYQIFNSIIKNKFFHVFLYSMNVYKCKILVNTIKSKITPGASADFSIPLFESFIAFITACLRDLDTILPLTGEVDRQLNRDIT